MAFIVKNRKRYGIKVVDKKKEYFILPKGKIKVSDVIADMFKKQYSKKFVTLKKVKDVVVKDKLKVDTEISKKKGGK